jgi:6,7-dimethyl-8-ribityllumazine synthase
MVRIAFIQSCWHKEIVDQFKKGFVDQFGTLEEAELDYLEAPGVVEIPLLAKLCAKKIVYDAIVVAGLVVDHGIYRHEFVAGSVMQSIMGVQMEFEVPIVYGILTPQDFLSEGQEAFFFQHMLTKGVEAANACSRQLANVKQVKA